MQNKQLVQRLYDDHVNPDHLDDLGDVLSAELAGPFATTIATLRASFPDLRYTLEDTIAEGDRVVVRWTLRGTHTGEFRGLAPTGKRFVNDGMAIFRIANGKIVAATVQTDRLGFLLAIGKLAYDPSFGPPPRTE